MARHFRVTTWDSETQSTTEQRVIAPDEQAAIHAVEGPVTDVEPWSARESRIRAHIEQYGPNPT